MENFLFAFTPKNPSQVLAKSNKQQAKWNEQRAKSNEQWAKSNEQQAKSNEQRAKSNEQRATSEKFHLITITLEQLGSLEALIQLRLNWRVL